MSVFEKYVAPAGMTTRRPGLFSPIKVAGFLGMSLFEKYFAPAGMTIRRSAPNQGSGFFGMPFFEKDFAPAGMPTHRSGLLPQLKISRFLECHFLRNISPLRACQPVVRGFCPKSGFPIFWNAIFEKYFAPAGMTTRRSTLLPQIRVSGFFGMSFFRNISPLRA